MIANKCNPSENEKLDLNIYGLGHVNHESIVQQKLVDGPIALYVGVPRLNLIMYYKEGIISWGDSCLFDKNIRNEWQIGKLRNLFNI